MQIDHRAPWLIVDLPRPMRALSWAPHRSGLVETRRVVWREVRDADLTPDLDVGAWLHSELAEAGLSDAVTLLTSRSLAKHHRATHRAGDAHASCLATVGLGNAERVGHRVGAGGTVGTINILACLSPGLTEAAMVEAVALAAEARTAAVTEVCRTLPTGIATGTGTDCIVIAAPGGETAHAGKHTDVGHALGRAVFDAVLAGASEWMSEQD